MKISKTAVLALGGVFATAGLGFMYVSAAEKWVFMNLNNAVQHFVEVKFVEKGNDDGVMIKRGGNTNPSININRTDAGSLNFILTKTGATELNTISNSKSSSILGGVHNTIYGKDNNVILGGELNTIKGSSQGYNNVILGGNGNTIQESSQSTILGGNGNTVNGGYYQTVIGNGNHTNASSSVAIGKSNNINQNATSSAALGSNATVSSAESFIWSDGKTSTLSSQAFAVVGENGMAVNAQAHAFAKLTIGGSLRINELSSLSCDSSKVGVVKMVTKSGSKKCFCSCDGTSWNSLNGGGSCASKCDSNVKPSCGTDVSCGGNPIKYEGSCTRGKVVEGDDAYFIDKTNKLHWSCEEEDGSVVPCAQPAPTCNVSVPQASCNLPAKSCNLPVDGDASLLKQSAVTEDENNYYWTCYYGVKDTPCKLGKKSCNAEDKTYGNCKYSVPALSNGASQTVSNSVAGYNGSVVATCNDAILTYSNWTCTPKSCGAEEKTYGSCKYSVPALSNGASQTVSNSVAGYNGSVLATCTNGKVTYSNYVCNANPTGCGAEDKTYGNCKYSVPALSNGASKTVSNSVAGYNGSVLATCTNGKVTYSNYVCNANPTGCGAEDKTYGNCKYSVPALSNGASQTVSNSVAGYNGSVKATCTNGKLTYSNYVCNANPTGCGAEDKTYGNCKYSVPALSNGASQTVSNSVAGYNGSVKATCTNGKLTYSNYVCNANPTGCGAEDKTYGNCKYSVPALSNGASKTVSNSVAGYNGSVKATCTNGKLTYSNYVCNKEDHGECDTSEPYGCENSKNTVLKVDTMSSTEWQWYCKGSDDTGNGSYCHVNCAGLGQEGTLKWTSLHNGTCVKTTTNGQCGELPVTCSGGTVSESHTIGNTASVWSEGSRGVSWTCAGNGGSNATCTAVVSCNGTDQVPYCTSSRGGSVHSNSSPYCRAQDYPLYGCSVKTSECSGGTPLPSKDSTKYRWNSVPYSTKTYWEYVDPSNFNPGIPCAWTCQDGYAVNSTKTECVLNAQPVCGKGEVNHYGQLQTSALCDSSSNYSNLNSTDGREMENGCGTQAWTRTCRHKESGNEKRCYQTKRVAHFGMTFTPATQGNLAAGIIGTLSTGPDDYKWSDVEWFYVELKVTSNSGREGNITVVVSPKDTYLNQDRITYTLRVGGNPPTVGQAGYPEMTIGMPNSYIGGPDMSVKKVEITAIHPRRFASDYIGGQYIPKYDALGHRYDYLGNKQCNSNVGVIYGS